MSVSIQESDFDLAAELNTLRSGNSKVGAMVSFVGLVRDFNLNETVDSIYLEYYPGMTEKALNKIIAEATERWNLLNVRVIHRIGRLYASDQIVLVATTALHRGEAFAGCEFIIDYLKTAAPFWKKEETGEGSHWLETRETDVQRMEYWHSDKVRKSA
ncbi:molybdenum cofactor biosynthesis protein MoaE [Candidatus Nitrotoga fabula]|uniref:Molybdopterin synthase catalytic subunit n=1 Tax=Candidatus Nitrotoga fabula TaxID=2182327 RepID=A0A916F9Q7_9PROT|nr:molybdenum cofactor biosynthesis protein MoaE [Candidatus Nitrotoga fabula]CAE6735120.1 Molybdopterin synthase catalytic subunit [Candidatus Nitrotoga fabula]